MYKTLPSTVQIVHQYLQAVLRPGGVGLDATAGNGHDTVFMAELVGPAGRVYSFDIQETAVKQTYERVKEKGLLDTVVLFKESHDRLNELVPAPIDAAVFNLGYLPGGDHSIITRPQTTVGGISQALSLLKPGGIVCAVFYPGHAGGLEELEQLEQFLTRLDKTAFCAAKLGFINRSNAPGLLVIEKNSSAAEVKRNENTEAEKNS